ncbi:MAG TPA: adenylate/guanylate cyclase domain-containing protein, partial [Candidatus Obscuribacterales bacterium]
MLRRCLLKFKPNLSSKSTSGRRKISLIYLSYVIIGCITLGSTALTATNHPLTQLIEKRSQIIFYRLRGVVTPPDDIIILAIDQASLIQGEFYTSKPEQYADLAPIQSWPWQRRAYAIALDRLMQARARSVSLDVLFLDPSSYGVEDDQSLEQALQAYGDRIVLAGFYDAYSHDGNLTHQLALPILWGSEDNYHGHINVIPGVDGRIYDQPSRYYDEVIASPLPQLPSFAEASLQAAERTAVLPPNMARSELYYYGPGGRTFRQVPFWEILDPVTWARHQRQRTFDNKIVLIGATAVSLEDLVRTPFDDHTPGVELHATAIANYLQGKVVTHWLPRPGYDAVLVLMITGSSGILLWVVRKASRQVVATLVLFLSWASISYIIFVVGRHSLPTMIPLGAIALSGSTAIVANSIQSQLEQQRLRRTLERYVASPIVQEILTHYSEDYQSLLKGKRLNATILFCDIRGFTTLSMNSDPEALVEQLNEYLDVMVEVILNAGGTVDKFIGDAIMAEFGSPLSQGERTDTLNAVRAVLEMRKALVHLQAKWQDAGKPILFNGIGLNFGEVVAGDIGSLRRREYAVIGDTVNIASRVEGMTRKFWTDILITDSVYQWVKDEVNVVCVGNHPLKGRERNTVRLYTLVGMKGDDPSLYRTVH